MQILSKYGGPGKLKQCCKRKKCQQAIQCNHVNSLVSADTDSRFDIHVGIVGGAVALCVTTSI